MELKSYQNICLHLKLPKNRTILQMGGLFLPKHHGNNVVCDFVYSCALERIGVSQCPFWRSSSVSKISLVFYHSVCFLCSKQNVNRLGVMYIKHVHRATPPATVAPPCLRSLLIGYRVINNPSINAPNRNRFIPMIPEICFTDTLCILK